jgi:hypothetical protein
LSADIVNLRRARRAKLRAADADQAAANRVFFGRTRGERTLHAKQTARTERTLDGHRLSVDEPAPLSSDGD